MSFFYRILKKSQNFGDNIASKIEQNLRRVGRFLLEPLLPQDLPVGADPLHSELFQLACLVLVRDDQQIHEVGLDQ